MASFRKHHKARIRMDLLVVLRCISLLGKRNKITGEVLLHPSLLINNQFILIQYHFIVLVS